MQDERVVWTRNTILCLAAFLALTFAMESNTTSSGSEIVHNEELENGSSADWISIENISSTSRGQMNPVPLTSPLNETDVEAYMQETNSKFISNTSLDDITNDNETLQIRLQNRQRKRQIRLMTIQLEILQKLGLEKEFNISATMTEEQRTILLSSYVQMSEFLEANNTDVD